MHDFLPPLITRIEVGLIIGLMIALLYFSIDICFYLTKKDFGRMNMYLIHFTRNDHQPAEPDAMNTRLMASKVSIQQDIFKNRFLFWSMILAGSRATLDCPVLQFGTQSKRVLMPIRDWFVAAKCSTAEIKRANGYPFKELDYFLTVVYDRSEDNKRNRVPKVLIIRADDLKNFQKYLLRPPKYGRNIDLVKKVAAAFEENRDNFLPLKIVAS